MLAKLWHLLTSFRGRISRTWWWIGLVIWLVANMGGGLLLNPEFFTAEEIPPPNLPDTLWQLACLLPLAAVTVKRCNDRDWPAWLGYAFAAIYASYIMALQLGIPIDPQQPDPDRALFWGLSLTQLLFLIDNGFFRGTDGPNRYGPDPLAPPDNPTA